jgi:hypothetical protein
MSYDERLLLEAFQMLYQVYREQKSGRKYFRPVSIYPVLAKIQKRLDKPVRRESMSIVAMREKANSPWT